MDFPCAQIDRTGQMLAIDFRLTNLESILEEAMSVDDFKIELHLAAVNAR